MNAYKGTVLREAWYDGSTYKEKRKGGQRKVRRETRMVTKTGEPNEHATVLPITESYLVISSVALPVQPSIRYSPTHRFHVPWRSRVREHYTTYFPILFHVLFLVVHLFSLP
jgi:hypothetical protein